jgi:hypothetical protein
VHPPERPGIPGNKRFAQVKYPPKLVRGDAGPGVNPLGSPHAGFRLKHQVPGGIGPELVVIGGREAGRGKKQREETHKRWSRRYGHEVHEEGFHRAAVV